MLTYQTEKRKKSYIFLTLQTFIYHCMRMHLGSCQPGDRNRPILLIAYYVIKFIVGNISVLDSGLCVGRRGSLCYRLLLMLPSARFIHTSLWVTLSICHYQIEQRYSLSLPHRPMMYRMSYRATYLFYSLSLPNGATIQIITTV